MASGQEYTRHQRGIINRYYEHIDTIALQKLSEIVSDLYLAEGKSATKLWSSARQALAKLAPGDDPRVVNVLSVRSASALAKLVTELSSGANATGKPKPRQHADESAELEGSPVIGEPTARAAPPVTIVAAQQTAAVESATPPSAAPTADQLKSAMKAFRKRLKLTKLDDESKLGRSGNPMSGGKKSQVLAIMPPREYPKSVWDELVRQGKLRASGGSFYELVEGV